MSPTASGRRISSASSIKSARRRSLPERASFDSEYSVVTPEIDVTTFQERRRKAAKLTQFFGVDYRELISDILQSIENGVEHDHMIGTLRAEEVEVSHPIQFIVHVTYEMPPHFTGTTRQASETESQTSEFLLTNDLF